jgi:hypothetical protein
VFDSIRALMREPLLHFLLGGAGLFLLFSLVNESNRVANDEIVVTAGQIDHIVSIFQKTRQRPPTDAELRGLIDSFIIEEVLYREAVAIGLDQDDTIIRRRLRQKMEFLLDDFTLIEPSDADLQLFLDNNPDQFRADAMISFEQVYLNEYSRDKAESALTRLQRGEIDSPDKLSESHLLPYRIENTSESVVSAQFGEKFKTLLFSLDVGQWTGPVESPFGIHLIRIDSITPGHIPDLSNIRKEVERDWLVDFRSGAQQKIIEQLRSEYAVTIEMPEDAER